MIGRSIGVVEKDGGGVTSLEWTNLISLESTSVVKMPFGPEDVESYGQAGSGLVIRLKNGETITVENFFTKFGGEDEQNELVLEDDDGVLWWGQFDPALSEFTFT